MLLLIVILLLYFLFYSIFFLLGLHSFTIVMLKQATLVFLRMAWNTTTSFGWIWRNTLPSNGNIFCVSSSLCLCVFYWFNLCTLERPKCTIHVLSFLISIKNILLIIPCLKMYCFVFLFVFFLSQRCVVNMSSAFHLFLGFFSSQLNPLYLCKNLHLLFKPASCSSASSLHFATSVCVLSSSDGHVCLCLSPALWRGSLPEWKSALRKASSLATTL